jgi:uncharacterized protein YlxW (UPF0749 family)
MLDFIKKAALKSWEWILIAGSALLAFYLFFRKGDNDWKEEDDVVKKKQDEIKKKIEEVKSEREKIDQKIEKSEERVEDLEKKEDQVDTEPSADKEELRDFFNKL